MQIGIVNFKLQIELRQGLVAVPVFIESIAKQDILPPLVVLCAPTMLTEVKIAIFGQIVTSEENETINTIGRNADSLRTVGCTSHRTESFAFLGVPETESSDKGPVGLIKGELCQIENVSPVSESTYLEYQTTKQDGRVFAEEMHGDWVYYAIKNHRDVRFDNASAWVEVIERFKARKP